MDNLDGGGGGDDFGGGASFVAYMRNAIMTSLPGFDND